MCDLDGNMSVSECEMFVCFLELENYRRENEINCPRLYCSVGECPEKCGKTCDEIMALTEDYIFTHDLNNDGYVNEGDLGIDIVTYTEFYSTCD
jgi:hypothetical protein